MDDERNFPTMIIPNGTEISVNEHGQLAIRTPGNLVIQNSGVYSVIESGNGSVRIDPGVSVEAVSVLSADSCFVAGELTAWRVKARKIILEKGAQANIMLQESETLELDRNARLVGNFASEKELYLMLPGSAAGEDPFVAPDGEDEPGLSTRQEQQELLALVRVLLERELGRPALGDPGRVALERLLELVRVQDLDGLQESRLYLLSQVEQPSEDLENVREMLERLDTL